MSIVAVSQTYASLGDEIGRELARTLSYEFADREIILQAAQRFGQAVQELEHVTEERPSLWERLTDTTRQYLTSVEAVVFELASRDNMVLAGRGAPFSLRAVHHALCVRISAPERLRAERLGLGIEAGLDVVRRSDRERAARVRFLYHVEWDDPMLYDLTLNTERLDILASVRLIRDTLQHVRFQPTEASRNEVRDLAFAARARAALLTNPLTQDLEVSVTCRNGELTLAGRVAAEDLRAEAEEAVGQLPGLGPVHNEISVVRPTHPGL